MVTRKRIFIGAGIAVAVISLSGIGLWQYAQANSPEKILYKALGADYGATAYAKEETVSGKNTSLTSHGLVKQDGTYRMQGTMTCDAKGTALGDLELKAEVTQVQEKGFMRFDALKLANTGDAEIEAAVNEYFTTALIGKTIHFADPDVTAEAFKKDGVLFSSLSAYAKDLTAAEMVKKLQDNKVITINSTKQVQVDGKAAIEYDLSVRRSAYEKFMDDVKPNFSSKTEVADALFDNNTEEVTLVVDKQTKRSLSMTYAIANPCLEMVSAFDASSTGELSEIVRIKSTPDDKKTADKIAEPAEFITEDEFAELMPSE